MLDCWKIKCEDTIFNGETKFIEDVDTNKLNRILKSGYDYRYKDKEIGYKTLQTHIKNIIKKIENDTITNNPKLNSDGYGRAYYEKSLSIGSLPSDIRHTIARDKYIDFDLDNAHFNILYQICRNNKIPEKNYKNIKMYCENRENVIEQVVHHYFNIETDDSGYEAKRKQVKQLFIRMGLYLGGFSKWKKENKLSTSFEQLPILSQIKSEVCYITNHFIIPNNKKIYNQITEEIKNRKEKNANYFKDPKSTIVSHFLSNIEREIVEYVLKSLTDDFDIAEYKCIYCYDGFMLHIDIVNLVLKEGGLGETNDICNLLEQYTEDCGYDMKWSIKPFTKDILPDVIELEKGIENNKVIYDIDIDILEKGEAFVCNHIVKYLDGLCHYTQKRFYIYNERKGLWVMYENLYTKITDIINSCIDGAIEKITKQLKTDISVGQKDKLRGEIKSYHSFYKQISKTGYISAIEKNLKNQLKNDEFYELLDSNVNVLAFKNGIYDMKTKILREYRAEDHITKRLDFDYEDAEEEDIEYVKKELLKICNVNKAHLDYYLSCLAQSLTGERLKVLYFLIGLTGNNGKSMLLDCLERILPIYVTKIPNTVIEKETRDKHKFLPKLSGKRCVYIEELNKKKLNENFLKEMSGNDKMTYNVMYGCSADLRIRFNLFMISNHSPNLKTDGGIRNRNRLITFESQFPQDQKEDDYDNKIFIQDKELGDKLVGKYRNALLNLLLEYVDDYYTEGSTKPIPVEFQEDTENLNDANEDSTVTQIKSLVVANPVGRLSKETLVRYYKDLTHYNNVNNRAITDTIKLVFGVKYEKDLSFTSNNGKRTRGGWKGLCIIDDPLVKKPECLIDI